MAQAPAFTPANALERLLMAASGGDDGRAAFEAAVVDSELWVAIPAGADPAGETLTFLTVTPPDGRPATAVFTARERVEAAFPQAQPVGFGGRDLLAVIQVNPAVLNPGSPYGARWTPPMMAAMLGQPAPAATRPDYLAMPAVLPSGLVEGLTRELGGDPAVRGAWLALARWQDQPEPGFLLQVSVDDGAAHLPALMSRAMAGVELDARLDVVTRVGGDQPGEGLELVALR